MLCDALGGWVRGWQGERRRGFILKVTEDKQKEGAVLALVWRPEQKVGQALSGDTHPLGLSLLYVFAYCSLFIGCHSQCGGKIATFPESLAWP